MPKPSDNPISRKQRRLDAVRLHQIEGNPFTPEDNAVFEMFDHKGWTDAQRREFLIQDAKRHAGITDAAE